MKLIIQTVVALLIVSSVVAASTAIIRTYKNEINILNVYKSLTEIKKGISIINRKIDNL